MSFSFKVTKADGKLTVDDLGMLMHIPDGTFQIGGHSDNGANETLHVTQTSPDGQRVAQATSWHK
jgi:hypothetical protein